MRVPEITRMRGPKVDFCFCERVDAIDVLLVCEDARRQARDDLLGVEEVGAVKDVLVDQNVFSQECSLMDLK